MIALFTALVPAPPAGAQDETEAPQARVVEVVDGDTLFLDDGRQVRLVGLQAPKLPLGRRGFVAWPLAGESKRLLEELALGKTVRREFGGRRVDRHDRDLAHLIRADGLWIQGAMLEAGMARVYSFPDNRARIDQLLTAERAARAAGIGIWSHPFYRLGTPLSVVEEIGSFQIVEGRIVEANIVRGRAYLNFGDDWRSDFTVSVSPQSRRSFNKDGIDLEVLGNRRVRVRGWIKDYNGPLIEATHPEQIELLD